MAVFETMKAVLSARTVLRLGPVVPRKLISPMSCIPVQDTKDDLSLNLRHLTLSPAEAQLSSQFLASAVSASSQNTAELRLPPLRKPAIITVPTLYNGVVLEKDLPPLLNILEKIDPFEPQQSMETPPSQVVEKQAARLIVIRRRKMRRHKLKKLRKKMKYTWLKVRQKREYRKEKLFQAEQMAKVRQFQAFDAEQYVEDLLKRTKEKPVPKTWKSQRLPEFLIKELMEEERLKKIKNKQKILELKELKKIKDNYERKF